MTIRNYSQHTNKGNRLTKLTGLAICVSALTGSTHAYGSPEERTDGSTNAATVAGETQKPDDRAHPQSPPNPVSANTTTEPSDDFKSLAFTVNPITFLMTLVGANIEYLPARHHGIMLNPFVHPPLFNPRFNATSFYGAEIGYHYYTGTKGADGFFLGPSLIYEYVVLDDRTSFSNAGIILDVGAQYVSDSGFTIGFGVGLSVRASLNKKSSYASSDTPIWMEGYWPRVLFMMGHSF